MKEGITSLDLMFLTRELKEKLLQGKIQGIKQIDKTFIFEIYKQERLFLKVLLPKAIYITKTRLTSQPKNFCMLLRKYLMNKIISDFRQHEFDRIVEVELDGFRLIFELFSTGNVILTDSSNLIIGVAEQQVWKDRELKPKTIYRFPPMNLNPFKYKFFEFQEVLKGMNKEIVRCLATDFGFGGEYAEEICKRLEIEKSKLISQLEQKEIDKLFRFFEQVKSLEVKPSIVLEEKKSIDVIPFEMVSYEDKEKIEFSSFNEAVEVYFEGLERITGEGEIEAEEKRIEEIVKRQRTQLKNLEDNVKKYRKTASLLYEKYSLFNEILNGINRLKQEGKSWEEIKKIIKTQETEESKLVKEIREQEAKVVVFVDGIEIELDFRKSLEENASYYFEEAKRLEGKIEGLIQAMKKFEVPIEKEAKIKPKALKQRKKWFERYRWFFSSNGILVIAGKNARNNETIIKRYTRPYDLVLHADLHDSPFAVIRNDEKLVLPAETIYEAAELVATYSKAWDEKIPQVSVFYVKPEQVVKEAGLPLGSFFIKGERKWLEKIKPRLSIGIKEEETSKAKVISGPVTAVKKQTPYLVTIVPGDKEAKELAREIKAKLLLKVPYEMKKTVESLDLEEIKKIIPYGKGEIVV